jgi:hypothetical protein
MRAEGMAASWRIDRHGAVSAARQGAPRRLCLQNWARMTCRARAGRARAGGRGSAPCPPSPSGRPYHSGIIVNPLRGTALVLRCRGTPNHRWWRSPKKLIARQSCCLWITPSPPRSQGKQACPSPGVPVAADIERQTIPNLEDLSRIDRSHDHRL